MGNEHLDDYYAMSSELGTVFGSREWHGIYNDKLNVFGIFDKGNKLTGGFHLFETRKYGLKYYRNPPFSPHIGLFFENRSKNPAKAQSTVKNILSAVSNFLLSLRFRMFSAALPPGISDSQPFTWDGFKVIPSFTYRIDLSAGPERIFGEMMPERRNDINKARKDGIETIEVSDMDLVGNLVRKTFARQDKSLDMIHLESILNIYANENNSYAFVSFQEGKPIATCFCIYDKRTVYYLLGGYDDQNSHKGAGASAIWKAIEKAAIMKVDFFDFEGSMVPQIERYFRGFGGALTPYYTVNRASLPIEILLKFVKRDVF